MGKESDDLTRPKDATKDIDAAWRISLVNVADLARRYDESSRAEKYQPKAQRQEAYSVYLFEVLQARASLKAAETSRKLVHATWWLVGVTAALALTAIVAWGMGPPPRSDRGRTPAA